MSTEQWNNLPAWMDEASPDYDPRWREDPRPLPAPIWVRFANGADHSTIFRQVLADWIKSRGAVLIDGPDKTNAKGRRWPWGAPHEI